jgi:ribosomal protein S18 acetylase RimI-like enzyme
MDLVGFLLYWHSPDLNLKRSKLIDIFILEKFRDQGYGNGSTQFVLNESIRFNSMYLSLFVSHSNLIAQKMYTRMGFKDWKEFAKGKYMLHPLWN